MTSSAADRLSYACNPAGVPIAEIELAPHDTSQLRELAIVAALHGARLLCVYSAADLSGAGFHREDGYLRLTAADAPAGAQLPVLDQATVREVWPRSFVGQWGHHLVERDDYDAVPDAVFLGLPDNGNSDSERWLGICRVEPGRRHIDGPGFAGWAGDRAAAQALVLGAGRLLGSGPATLETWGDKAEHYLPLGYEVAEECPGWELPLAAQG